VGVGFGLQNIVSNFVSGLILLFERPIKAGDWIVVQSGEGYVKRIGVRATEIETFDRASILVPNSELVSSTVKNWFHGNSLGRLELDVGVSYSSDPDKVRDLLIQCASEHGSIMSHPAPEVTFSDFADSALVFRLRAYLKNYDKAYRVRSELRFAIFAALSRAGIVIPFPQRDVHISTEPVEPPPSSGSE
jgi:potassium-dependent mechanosensitive channel